MLFFNTNIFITSYYLLFLTIVFISSAFFLPVSYGYENRFLENLEIIILGCGLISGLYRFNFIKVFEIKIFWLSYSIFYFIMIARELSFGRVFYPVGVGADGQLIFIKLTQLWYGFLVYPIITIMVILALIGLVKCYFYCKRKNIKWNIPVWHFMTFAVMMVLSQCVFEKDLIYILKPYGQLLEENTELLAYCALGCFTHDWSFEKNR